jgi:hypothetical protein
MKEVRTRTSEGIAGTVLSRKEGIKKPLLGGFTEK